MMFPLVLDLPDDGVTVGVTCRVFGFLGGPAPSDITVAAPHALGALTAAFKLTLLPR